MAVITDPDLLKELKKISEERCYKVYNKIVTTDYPSDPRFIDLSGRDIGYIFMLINIVEKIYIIICTIIVYVIIADFLL